MKADKKNCCVPVTDSFLGLSVIIPAVSETESFEQTCKIILEACNHDDIAEIIFAVPDRATPDCYAVAKKLMESDIGIPTVIYRGNVPFEQEIRETIELVRGSHFIYQPADLEEDPHMLATLIEQSKKNPNAIITASRVLSESGLSDCSIAKRIIYFPYRHILNVVYGTSMTDSTLIYNCTPAKSAKALKLESKSYSVLYELLLKMVRLGVEVVEVPVVYHKRKEGKTNIRFFSEGIRFMRVFFKVRFCSKSKFFT